MLTPTSPHSLFFQGKHQWLNFSVDVKCPAKKPLRPQQCLSLHLHAAQQRLSPNPIVSAASNSSSSAADDHSNNDSALQGRQASHSAASTSASTKPLSPALLAGIGVALILGAANRVLFKVALVPMQNYVFFLAQFQNFGYLLVYFTTLLIRARAGMVTPQMLQVDKRPFILIGACEAASQVFSMIGASHLPGILIPIINQSYLLWSFLFAALILKTRFHPSQLIGALLVVSGVAMSVLPPDLVSSLLGTTKGAAASTGPVLPNVQFKYVALVVACFSLPALASIVKDKLFREEKARLGQPLDIFVVNSFGSLFQAVFVTLLLPITASMAHIPFNQLPGYLLRGSQCLRGLTPSCGTDCSEAPLLPLAYIITNLMFNISMLLLLRNIGAVGTTMVSTLLVPLTILAFTFVPISYLPTAVISPNFLLGAVVLVCGQLTFNLPTLRAALSRPKPAPSP